MINVKMDVMTAIAVRSSLFNDTKDYTYDERSCPTRVNNLRGVIVELDKQIEEALTNEVTNT